MPRRDATGPEEAGPRTKLGQGDCLTDPSEAEASEDVSRTRGRMRRRDRCRDCGRGKSLRKGFSHGRRPH